MVAIVSVSLGSFPAGASVAIPGSQLWARRYNDPADGRDYAKAMTVSPDGSKVFVTGYVLSGDFDYVTVAYDASTGSKLWLMRYRGPAGGNDGAEAIGVSPDGSEVFVTGASLGSSGFNEFATLAYDASSGTQLWVSRYSGPSKTYNLSEALNVSPDGSEVFVTGESFTSAFHPDYATVAYDSATGAELWSKLYNGTGDSEDNATALAVRPDGSEVFVTGESIGKSGYFDYATVAYDTSTGKRLWSTRYKGPSKRSDRATALGVSPDGSEVFVTGESRVEGSNYDYVTVAYGTSDGAELWVADYDGQYNGNDFASAVGVSPDGSQVFVTGRSPGSTRSTDYATVAYAAVSGAESWVARYNGSGNLSDQATALGVSPDGSQVFVTGVGGSTIGSGYLTVAYQAGTGVERWVAVYSPGNATALGVSPDGSKVFVTGSSVGATTEEDYATVAYSVG